MVQYLTICTRTTRVTWSFQGDWDRAIESGAIPLVSQPYWVNKILDRKITAVFISNVHPEIDPEIDPEIEIRLRNEKSASIWDFWRLTQAYVPSQEAQPRMLALCDKSSTDINLISILRSILNAKLLLESDKILSVPESTTLPPLSTKTRAFVTETSSSKHINFSAEDWKHCSGWHCMPADKCELLQQGALLVEFRPTSNSDDEAGLNDMFTKILMAVGLIRCNDLSAIQYLSTDGNSYRMVQADLRASQELAAKIVGSYGIGNLNLCGARPCFLTSYVARLLDGHNAEKYMMVFPVIESHKLSQEMCDLIAGLLDFCLPIALTNDLALHRTALSVLNQQQSPDVTSDVRKLQTRRKELPKNFSLVPLRRPASSTTVPLGASFSIALEQTSPTDATLERYKAQINQYLAKKSLGQTVPLQATSVHHQSGDIYITFPDVNVAMVVFTILQEIQIISKGSFFNRKETIILRADQSKLLETVISK